MARFTDSFMAPATTITVSQQTIHDLKNNTVTTDLFEFLKKAIKQGYQIKFLSFGAGDNETIVKDINHLKNYINMNQGLKMLA